MTLRGLVSYSYSKEGNFLTPNLYIKKYKVSSNGEEYAQITKSIGNGFMEVKSFTSCGPVTKRAHIRGSMRKKIWMAAGDIVLISTRGYDDKTCDILHKYSTTEARILQARKQLPDNIDLNQTDLVAEEDNIMFVENSDDDISDEEKTTNKIKVAKQQRNLELPPSNSDDDLDNI